MSREVRTKGSPEPFELRPEHCRAGCLLIHGLTGSPAEMRPLAEQLAAEGYHCLAPLLPGHGTTLADLHSVRWPEWIRAAEAGLARLRTQNQSVFAAGLSLGTLIVAYLARRNPEIHGLALLSPAIAVSNQLLPLAPLLHAIKPTFPKGPSGLQAPDARTMLWHYDRWSTHALGELWHLQRRVRRELGHISVPALIVHSTQDTALAPNAAEYMFRHWGTPDKQILTLEHSAHVVTVDTEREKVFSAVSAFFDGRLVTRTAGETEGS
ncbi:MAG: alpha/beta fold hydrolase [Chloroflexi bacterium]|nr:alpha/beta fold hydrolase [Chloroflexota bacterium]